MAASSVGSLGSTRSVEPACAISIESEPPNNLKHDVLAAVQPHRRPSGTRCSDQRGGDVA
jgi:hypothetical protein